MFRHYKGISRTNYLPTITYLLSNVNTCSHLYTIILYLYFLLIYMTKHWIFTDSKSEKLILITSTHIHVSNSKKSFIENYLSDIKKNIIPKDLFGIPYNYIKNIVSLKNKIVIHYGHDSKEEIRISSQVKKEEVFIYLKESINYLSYSFEKPSLFSHTKAELLVSLSILGLFLWSTFLANEIEHGVEYELVGNKPGLGALALLLAEFGTIINLLFILIISLIAFYIISLKVKNRSKIETLTR